MINTLYLYMLEYSSPLAHSALGMACAVNRLLDGWLDMHTTGIGEGPAEMKSML